jgi:hypothetical protein
MSTIVRTTQSTHPLLIISKMVVVLLLIFLPAIAFANPIYQSSSNRYATPSTVGASSMQYQPASYQMTNTSNYQMSTTLNPAQTVYAPFSNENPYSDANTGNNGPSKISGRKNTYDDGCVDSGETDRSEESPIGEPWILLAFAAAAAVVITLRKKQTA